MLPLNVQVVFFVVITSDKFFSLRVSIVKVGFLLSILTVRVSNASFPALSFAVMMYAKSPPSSGISPLVIDQLLSFKGRVFASSPLSV